MLLKFSLTFVIPLLQFYLGNTPYGVRQPCCRFSFLGLPFRRLLLLDKRIHALQNQHL
jgi:hypothetical protein